MLNLLFPDFQTSTISKYISNKKAHSNRIQKSARAHRKAAVCHLFLPILAETSAFSVSFSTLPSSNEMTKEETLSNLLDPALDEYFKKKLGFAKYTPVQVWFFKMFWALLGFCKIHSCFALLIFVNLNAMTKSVKFSRLTSFALFLLLRRDYWTACA